MTRPTWQLFHKALSDEFCDDVISLSNNYESEKGYVGHGQKGIIDKNARLSDVKFLDPGKEQHHSANMESCTASKHTIIWRRSVRMFCSPVYVLQKGPFL